jgi:cysteine-rich repeat protein
VLQGLETCDDGNAVANDGCSDLCRIEPGYDCRGEPSCCQQCGNGRVECDEACDGPNLGEASCLAFGLLAGPGQGLACQGCQIDASGCLGGPIDSEAAIRAALAEAWALPGHRVIAIRPSPVPTPGSPIPIAEGFMLDECGGLACPEGLPAGVSLRPLGERVILDASACPNPVFTVVTGENRFEQLTLREATRAFLLPAGGDRNRLRRLRIENAAVRPGTLLDVRSDLNELEACALVNDHPEAGEDAIAVPGEGTGLVGNLVLGAFTTGLKLNQVNSPSLITRVDHNSISIQGGTGLRLDGVKGLCMRNNLVLGDGASTGLNLKTVTLASAAACGGVGSQRNDVWGHATLCSGTACGAACTGGKALCDLELDPAPLGELLCPLPGSPLIDAGVDVGVDLVDDDSGAPYLGQFPEIGAREAGAARAYGGLTSSCPAN